MSAGRVARVVMGVVLAATAAYVFIYLGRWEWNRAMLAGVLFIAAEVAMATSVVLNRLGRMERRLDHGFAAGGAGGSRVSPETLARIQEAAPRPSQPFAWLRPQSDQFGVFVPILMGVGVVASGLAWLVERLARATAGPVLEKGLAGRLHVLSWPERPLEVTEGDVRSLLAAPQPGLGR